MLVGSDSGTIAGRQGTVSFAVAVGTAAELSLVGAAEHALFVIAELTA